MGKGGIMRILTITAITALALPLMALGQTAEPGQTQGQGQTKDTQAAPAKGKKMKAPEEPSKPQAKPGTATDERGQTNVKGRAHEIKKNQPGARSSTNETNVKSQTNVNQTTTVNKQEFKSRHSEVFSLGRHPKEFFVQRFGDRHFRLMGNSYFVFVDSCWVAVDVDGFVYTERVICPGDPDFIEVE
jgi:hypothetical protein